MTNPTEAEAAVKTAASVVDEVDRLKFDPIVRLSNGIVLRGKPVPRAVMLNVVRRIPVPPVPVVAVEAVEGGTRDEENPNDPDYLDAIEAMHSARLEATYRAAYALGTEVVSVPEGMYGPEADGWLEELAVVGAEADVTSRTARYLSWLQMYALSSQQDHSELYGACLAAAGIMEMEVVQAVAYFRDRAQRGAFGNAPAPIDAGDGDNVPAAAAGIGG